MKKTSEIVAIDLGTTKLAVVAGTRNEMGYFHIKALHSVPSEGIKHGEVQNIGSVVKKLDIIIRKLREESEICNIENVYVGIAGQHVRYIENAAERLRPDCDVEISETELRKLESDVEAMYLDPGDVILEVVPMKYTIDDKSDILDPVGRLGHKLIGHFHVLIGKANSKKHTEICMNKLNLPTKAIILEPIASSRAVLDEEEKQVGVVMVDMGGGTTDLIIYKNNIIQHTAVIPYGCNMITYDIEQCFNLSRERSEDIKTKYGTCDPSKYRNKDEYITITKVKDRPPITISKRLLAEVIRARVDEIIDMILAEIKPFRSELKLEAGIVFTGGGACMDGIKEFITVKSGMHVKIGKPNYISSESQKGVVDCMYSTAIGLLMCGSDNIEEKIENNFPCSAKPVKKEKKKINNGISPVPKIMDIFSNFFKETEEED